MFNKDSVLEYLLDKKVKKEGTSEEVEVCKYIKSAKDFVSLNLTEAKDKSAEFKFICPVTRKEMNSIVKFVFNEKCGCVFSEEAYKQLKPEKCFVCQENIGFLITLNPDKEEFDMLLKRYLTEAEKKNNKKKRTLNKMLQDMQDTTIVSVDKKDEFEEIIKKHRTELPKVLLAKESSKAIQSIYVTNKK